MNRLSQKYSLLAGIALFAILIAVFSSGADPRVVAVAQIAAAAGTLALAFLAYSQLRELRETRIAQERPQVIVDAEYKGQLVFLTIRNIGKGAARNINFEFSESVQMLERVGMSEVNELPCFANGVDYLAPGAEIPTLWDSMIALAPILKEQQFQGLTITSRYKSLSEDRMYETQWTINPLLMLGTSATPEASLNDLVKVLKDTRKDLQRLYKKLDKRT